MTQVAEAIARYHKLIESEPYIDLAWAEALQERLRAEHLVNMPISPVLRPHFLGGRDYAALERAAATLHSAIDRLEKLVLANPALMARMHLWPAERMLAAIEPGYSSATISGTLDASILNGSGHFTGYRALSPSGIVHAEALSDIYYDAPPVKEFRKKFKLTKLGGSRPLLQAILKAYKEFGGKNKKPLIAVVELRAPFQPAEASENAALVDFLRRSGFEAEQVSPEQLEYKNSALRVGDRAIDIVYRALRLHEFLVRFDLNHAFVRAYKDRAVCMVNSFRTEVTSKRALFDLLTDESVTAKFPAAERKAVKDYIPWTRVVQAGKTTHGTRSVDFIEYVMKHRTKLVLRPNDQDSDQSIFRGAELDEPAWEKALRQAMRSPYVAQEVTDTSRSVFPLLQYGSLVMKEMNVGFHPNSFQGKVHGASSWLTVAGSNGFSTLSGLAPAFLLEGK
ncbi:MAG: hypothetical protein ABL967_13835 [Bryobacteraceae bacterium]